MDVETETVKLSLTVGAVQQLTAFTQARNGSVHNQADALLRAGVKRLIEDAPQAFRDNYLEKLRAIQAKAPGHV